MDGSGLPRLRVSLVFGSRGTLRGLDELSLYSVMRSVVYLD